MKKLVAYGIVVAILLSSISIKDIRVNDNGSVIAVAGDEGEKIKDLE